MTLLSIVVLAVSTAGPIVASAQASALAMAFWRVLLGALATLPFLLARRGWREISKRDRKLIVVAGLILGTHFALWIPSVRFTTVAAAVALVSTQPMFSAMIASFSGVHVPKQVWAGIVTAIAGVLGVMGMDFSLSGRALIGDLMALGGAITMAFYLAFSARIRQRISTPTYASSVFGVAAMVLLIFSLFAQVEVVALTRRDWLLILALAIGPQLLGHSIMLRIVTTTSPTVIGVAVLVEIPIAAFIAANWLGQEITSTIAFGVALILTGLALVVTARAKQITAGAD
jgi:drug/metabolite transporter (DMT)-like permease